MTPVCTQPYVLGNCLLIKSITGIDNNAALTSDNTTLVLYSGKIAAYVVNKSKPVMIE